MPLRLVNKSRTSTITACDTVFHIISMSIGEKEQLVYKLQNLGSEDGAWERLLGIITPAIVRIEGFESRTVEDVLGELEDLEQLREIIQAIIAHCTLTSSERKNLLSSSEQPTPDSAGNAENNAGAESEPA